MSRHYDCPQCGRKVGRLEKVTSDDIQREKEPPAAWQYMYEECHQKMRSIGRFEPQYSVERAIRDALLLVHTLSVLLITLAVVSRISFYIGALTIVAGIATTWDRFKKRYAATHNLRWSLNSRQILIALSVITAGIISSIVSAYVYS